VEHVGAAGQDAAGLVWRDADDARIPVVAGAGAGGIR